MTERLGTEKCSRNGLTVWRHATWLKRWYEGRDRELRGAEREELTEPPSSLNDSGLSPLCSRRANVRRTGIYVRVYGP